MATTPNSFWKTPMALGCCGVIALAGTVVVVNIATSGSENSANALPAELTVASLTTASNDGDRRGMFREVINRDDLTDDQRRQAFRNMRDVGRRQRQESINEYFAAATQEEKNAILDQQIDEFMNRREERQQRREQRDGEGENDREKMRELFPPPTQQERKARSESRNPDQTAKSMAYRSAMRSRMTERGISSGPGRGGPGGGRRGP